MTSSAAASRNMPGIPSTKVRLEADDIRCPGDERADAGAPGRDAAYGQPQFAGAISL